MTSRAIPEPIFVPRAARNGAVPCLTGIAIGNDTDQTGETVTAWFGDFRIEARR